MVISRHNIIDTVPLYKLQATLVTTLGHLIRLSGPVENRCRAGLIILYSVDNDWMGQLLIYFEIPRKIKVICCCLLRFENSAKLSLVLTSISVPPFMCHAILNYET